MFRTNKNSIIWQLSQTGIQSSSFNAVEAKDSNLFIGTYNGFYVSHNNGDSYSAIPAGKSTANFYFDNNDVYACSARGYKSADNGYTWTNINFPYGFFSQSLTDLCIVNGNYFGLNIDQSLKYSADNGVTWNVVNGIPASTALCLVSNNGILYVGTSNGIYYSSNPGNTWSVALAGIFFRKIKIENGNVFALSSGALYVSYNNGSTWNNLNCPATNLNAFDIKNNTIIVSPGLFYTNNFGANWDSISAPVVPFQTAPTTLCMNNDYLFAGFYSSVFRLPLSIITTSADVTINQNTLEISPNPVKDILHVHFKNKYYTDEKIVIKISDAMGRIVFEKRFSSSINEQIEINLSGLSKGIYIMQATVHGKQLVKKFVKD